MSGDKHGLNALETRVLELLVQGLRTSEISKYLAISYHDAAELAREVRQKLGASSLAELRRIAANTDKPDHGH